MSKIIFRVLILIVFTSCNSQTMFDIYKNENLPLQIEGNVEEVILYKGGNTSLKLQTEDGEYEEIAVASEMKNIIKHNDYFIKEGNSNKCKVVRNDSIILLDCYNIPERILDSLGAIEEWPNDKKGIWHLKQE